MKYETFTTDTFDSCSLSSKALALPAMFLGAALVVGLTSLVAHGLAALAQSSI